MAHLVVVVEAATSQHQHHLVLEAWTRQCHLNFRHLPVMNEHHHLHQLVQQPPPLHLRHMVLLLIRRAFTQADFAIYNHQTCK
jgi:hypothetical protein